MSSILIIPDLTQGFMTISSLWVFPRLLLTGNRLRDPQNYWYTVQNICGFGRADWCQWEHLNESSPPLEIGARSQESGVRRKEEEGRRKEEEGRSHNKCFYVRFV
ncbi:MULTISPECIES: hypothetical protein [unclassified Microcoleus]|uniref:hypothetical protein n=1 Tax=unclassified Microcoleus TaxID=2642155 RepID=UPI002FD008A9